MQREYLALADKSLDTDVVSGSSEIIEASEDPTPEVEVDASPPDASQDAEPQDGLETNSSDSRTSGQRVRDLAVANSKIALEQSKSGRPPNPTASSRETRRLVQERIRLGQRANRRRAAADERFRTRGGAGPSDFKSSVP
jgi:hypothetical protein